MKWFLLCLPLFVLSSAYAQWQTDTSRMYRVNPYVAVGMFAVGTTTNILGIDRIQDGPRTPVEEVLALDKNDVNGFDRWVLFQEDVIDLKSKERRFTPREYSDWALYGGGLMPALLFLDKEIRRDWKDVIPMYMEAQTLSANMWAWSPLGPQVISRFRPAVYYDEIELSERTGSARRASFFSGHVTTAAMGSMFFARVYCDYHPEMKRKWLVYAGASVVPVWSAYWRIKDLAHFPSDLLVGAAIGTAIGVLVPHFHKRQRINRRLGLSAIYHEEVKGMAAVWRF